MVATSGHTARWPGCARLRLAFHCSQTVPMLPVNTIIFKEVSLLLTWQSCWWNHEGNESFNSWGGEEKVARLRETKVGNKFKASSVGLNRSISGKSRNLNRIITGFLRKEPDWNMRMQNAPWEALNVIFLSGPQQMSLSFNPRDHS